MLLQVGSGGEHATGAKGGAAAAKGAALSNKTLST
jgi:hypothetical protein